MSPAWLDGIPAGRARLRQWCAAGRAEGEPATHESAASALPQWGIAQNEIQYDADRIGDENRQQSPHHIAHPPSACIARNVADEQNIYRREQRNATRKGCSSP